MLAPNSYGGGGILRTISISLLDQVSLVPRGNFRPCRRRRIPLCHQSNHCTKVKVAMIAVCGSGIAVKRGGNQCHGGEMVTSGTRKGCACCPGPAGVQDSSKSAVFPSISRRLPKVVWISQTFNTAMVGYKENRHVPISQHNNSKTIQNGQTSGLGRIRPKVESQTIPSHLQFFLWLTWAEFNPFPSS